MQRLPSRSGESGPPPAVTVVVRVPSLDAASRAGTAEALLHHMLFMRGQIPAPWAAVAKCADDYAKAEEQEQPSSVRRKRSHVRKLQRYVAEVSEAVQGLHRLCGDLDAAVRSISFMFGASATAPRELVTLSFTVADPVAVSASGTSRVDVDAIKRKVIREVIGAFSSLPTTELPATALFISITATTSSSAAVAADIASSLGSAGPCPFSVRDGFRPTPRKRGCPPLCVTLETTTPPSPLQLGGEATGVTVFVLRRGIKAISPSTINALFC